MTRYKGVKKNGKKFDEHRLVAKVQDSGFNTIVHHKDGNKLNNDLENLEVMSRSDHCKLHGFGKNIRPSPMFAPSENGTGICRKCHKEKPWTDFLSNKYWSHGKVSLCLECANAYKREWRARKGS